MNESEPKAPFAQCDECTLVDEGCAQTFNPKIKQHPVLFIGEAAGEIEILTRQPFTGPAGKMHYRCLASAGLRKELLPHTNVCLCYPRVEAPSGKKKDTFRKPSIREIRCCHARLKADIHAIKPKLIVALGDTAMQALTTVKGKITARRDTFAALRDDFEFQCEVLIALHPSFCMRVRAWIPSQIETYKKITRYLKGEKDEPFTPDIIYDPGPLDLDSYLSKRRGMAIACDLETTGLNVRRDEIIGIAFSDGETGCAIRFTGPHDDRWPIVRRFIESDQPKNLAKWII